MKINIGPYKGWIGPYQIADKIPFVSDDTRFAIGEWLADTWVLDFCRWIDSHKKRKIKIHIDKYDTWNMDHTLSLIILPMLKQLKATKHGSQIVDDEDVPPHMRHSDPKVTEEGWDAGDNWIHYKWEWVLNELIWTFETLSNDDWEYQFFNEKEFDKEGHKQYNERIANGLRLFGKYYRGLWD